MTFTKGKSGNPAGRPKGVATKQTKLRAEIAEHLPGIIDKTVEMAKGGDTTAIKLLMDRVLPALRPVDTPVSFALGGTLTESGQAVLQAVETGSMTPDQASKLLTGIGTLARVTEVDELTRRVEALENGNARKTG